jgi:peptide deformylase
MIITNNEELLRTPCEDVKPEEVAELRATLEAELSEANRLGKDGIGLAAPQIGIFKKMAIIRLGTKDLEVDLVNCKMSKGYDEAIFRSEGCLSFPGRVENTLRYQECHVTGNLIYPHEFVVTGLLAIAVQHELDHLNGILLPDRAIVPAPLPRKNPKPNEPCTCRSGKKFKKCCGLLVR